MHVCMHACMHACMHMHMNTYTFTYSNPQVCSQGPEDRECMTPSFVIANVLKMRGWLKCGPSIYAAALNGWPEQMTTFKNMSLKLFLHQALPFRVCFSRTLMSFLIFFPPRLSCPKLRVHFLRQTGQVKRTQQI